MRQRGPLDTWHAWRHRRRFDEWVRRDVAAQLPLVRPDRRLIGTLLLGAVVLGLGALVSPIGFGRGVEVESMSWNEAGVTVRLASSGWNDSTVTGVSGSGINVRPITLLPLRVDGVTDVQLAFVTPCLRTGTPTITLHLDGNRRETFDVPPSLEQAICGS
jgi:hypothetical protein